MELFGKEIGAKIGVIQRRIAYTSVPKFLIFVITESSTEN